MIFDEISIDNRIFWLFGISFGIIIASGLVLGFVGYFMAITDNALQGISCSIPDNTLVSTCQELFSLSIYPFLALRNLFIWVSYFAIFASVIGILVAGYASGTSSVMMGILTLTDIIMVYLSIWVSNIYRGLIENSVVRAALSEYSVYNKIMLYFPWFVFIVSIFAVFISIVNYQKTKVNGGGISSLDY